MAQARHESAAELRFQHHLPDRMLLLFRSVKPSAMFPSRLAEMFSDSMLALLQFVTVAHGASDFLPCGLLSVPTKNRASIALKMAASTLRVSNTYLGAQFRRFRTRLGAAIAIKAMAAKLARLVYRMLRYGTKYVDQSAKFYEAQHRDLQIKQFKWKAAKLGFQVVQSPAA